jgi:hypothetical protein
MSSMACELGWDADVVLRAISGDFPAGDLYAARAHVSTCEACAEAAAAAKAARRAWRAGVSSADERAAREQRLMWAFAHQRSQTTRPSAVLGVAAVCVAAGFAVTGAAIGHGAAAD